MKLIKYDDQSCDGEEAFTVLDTSDSASYLRQLVKAEFQRIPETNYCWVSIGVSEARGQLIYKNKVIYAIRPG